MNYKEEILRSIKVIMESKLNHYKADKTYRSVIKDVTPKGYVIEEMGVERTVRCCIPGIKLQIGQGVWVKEPMGDLKEMHICGVVTK